MAYKLSPFYKKKIQKLELEIENEKKANKEYYSNMEKNGIERDHLKHENEVLLSIISNTELHVMDAHSCKKGRIIRNEFFVTLHSPFKWNCGLCGYRFETIVKSQTTFKT